MQMIMTLDGAAPITQYAGTTFDGVPVYVTVYGGDCDLGRAFFMVGGFERGDFFMLTAGDGLRVKGQIDLLDEVDLLERLKRLCFESFDSLPW